MTDDTSASHSEESPTAPLPETADGSADPATPQAPGSDVSSVAHNASPGTVAAIVAGALVVAALAFGGGWMSRGFADHVRLGTMAGFSAAGHPLNNTARPGVGGPCGMPGAPGGQLRGRGMQNNPGQPDCGCAPDSRFGRGPFRLKQAPSRAQTPTVPGAPSQ